MGANQRGTHFAAFRLESMAGLPSWRGCAGPSRFDPHANQALGPERERR